MIEQFELDERCVVNSFETKSQRKTEKESASAMKGRRVPPSKRKPANSTSEKSEPPLKLTLLWCYL